MLFQLQLMELLVFAIALKGQNNALFTLFASACQIIISSLLTKSKHLTNNKLLNPKLDHQQSANFNKLQNFQRIKE